MHKDYKRLVKTLKRHGVSIASGTKHFELVASDGVVIGRVPHGTSSGQGRAIQNLRAQLRRQGYPV